MRAARKLPNSRSYSSYRLNLEKLKWKVWILVVLSRFLSLLILMLTYIMSDL